MTLRPLTKADAPFQRAMLMGAAYWRSDAERPPIDEALSSPDLAHIVDGWGREGDTGFIAESDEGESVGAIWYRFYTDEDHSWGYISPEIPELAIGVAVQHRGKGIGAALIQRLIDHANEKGIAQLSLSVETENPARNLYTRLGFKKVAQLENAWTMVCDTKSS